MSEEYVCPNGCKGSHEIKTRWEKGIMLQVVKCLMCGSLMEYQGDIVPGSPPSSPVHGQQNF